MRNDRLRDGDAHERRIDQGHVAVGIELEGAQEALAGVLDLPREQRIGGIIKSVQHVSTALAPAPSSGIRDQLAEQLEAFTRAPMVLQP